MSKGKVLIVGSNATRIEVQGGRTGATGQYLNETVVPTMAVIAAGYDVVLATPNGTKPHSHRFVLHDAVWKEAGVRDVTAELRAIVI